MSTKKRSNGPDDETSITEITIQPDGRIYVFGTSRQVLEVLQVLNPGDARLGRLVAQVGIGRRVHN
ncbi:MAG TPA: hypothetical protein VIM11_17125 [Tepidisphaeraceae bacterium]|jgi:hypothetical protein